MTEQHPFTWRHFQSDIILLCVRWYLRYSLSYRDLEEIMLERGLHVDHTTIYRWVQHYAPALARRCRPHLNAMNDSWRVDETSIKVKKEWISLFGTSASLTFRLVTPYVAMGLPVCDLSVALTLVASYTVVLFPLFVGFYLLMRQWL